ncbi:MAG: hypothetical protein RL367_1529 [Pseudomonadota bacterium]
MPVKSEPACPLCKQPAVRDHAPFCSRRCQDRDLLSWLSGDYCVPITDDNTEQESGLDSEGNPRL